MLRRCLTAGTVVFLLAGAAWSQDTVTPVSGAPLLGEVTAVTRLEVTLKQGATTKSLPVRDVRFIFFQGEPTMLRTARTAVQAGRFEDALQTLARIDVAQIQRKPIVQDVEFYKAYCQARLAMLAGGDVQKAFQDLYNFARTNPESYHFLEVCEVIGDLLVSAGKAAESRPFYEQVASAPWPDYKLRAGVAVGRALLAEEKPQEALTRFEQALAIEAQGPEADALRAAATLGKGRSLAATGKADEGVALIQSVISSADAEPVDLHALAYNALGEAYRKAGKDDDALMAYLHVDVLYFSSPREHIEALRNLIDLWDKRQKPDRAEQARQTLRERYKVAGI